MGTFRNVPERNIVVGDSFSQMMAAKNDVKLVLAGNQENCVALFWEINSQLPTDRLFTSRHLTDSSLLFFYRSDQSQLSVIQFFQKLKTGIVSG